MHDLIEAKYIDGFVVESDDGGEQDLVQWKSYESETVNGK